MPRDSDRVKVRADRERDAQALRVYESERRATKRRKPRTARELAKLLREELQRMIALDKPLYGLDARSRGHVEAFRDVETWLEIKGF
jgi:hypothetical protein